MAVAHNPVVESDGNYANLPSPFSEYTGRAGHWRGPQPPFEALWRDSGWLNAKLASDLVDWKVSGHGSGLMLRPIQDLLDR